LKRKESPKTGHISIVKNSNATLTNGASILFSIDNTRGSVDRDHSTTFGVLLTDK